jgi:hypothetical protein
MAAGSRARPRSGHLPLPLLAVAAARLCCDAWFDVVLDWRQPDRRTSVPMAVLVEAPIAVLLLGRARLLLIGVPRREVRHGTAVTDLGGPPPR